MKILQSQTVSNKNGSSQFIYQNYMPKLLTKNSPKENIEHEDPLVSKEQYKQDINQMQGHIYFTGISCILAQNLSLWLHH